VIAIVAKTVEGEDISSLAGLHRRSPVLALAMTLALISLTGLPPMAGFFGKFMLLKSVVQAAEGNGAYYWLIAAAVFGVVVSVYYYFNVIRTIFFVEGNEDDTPIEISRPLSLSLAACVVGMLVLGLYPDAVVNFAVEAVGALS